MLSRRAKHEPLDLEVQRRRLAALEQSHETTDEPIAAVKPATTPLAPGWYPDPGNPGFVRWYYDGWTDNIQPESE